MPWSKDSLPDSVKELSAKWSDEQIETFIKTANATLESAGKEGEAIATGIKEAKKAKPKTNASDYPSFYYAKHMETGLAEYENERILIDTDNLKEMIPSFVGKPVVLLHQDINLENLEERDGTVVESFYNELDGWLWAKIMIETDECRTAIERGWSVSNCYAPSEWGAGGTHHNVPFDRRIVNGVFKHLAVVPNPRYEEAKIFTPEGFKTYQEEKRNKLKELHNSKEENKKMIKFFKNSKQEIAKIDEDTMLELENGKEVALKDMISAITNAKKNAGMDSEVEEEKKAGEDKINMDSEVDVDGEKMPIRELVNKYNTMIKKNAEDAEKKKKEKEEEDKKETDKDKENAKHYYTLMNAANKSETFKVIETVSDKVKRGNQLYGSAK